MNSLEWVNKEIRETLQSYKFFKLDYDLFHRASDKRDYQKEKLKLKYLKQIKTELEAWEVVKKDKTKLRYKDTDTGKLMLELIVTTEIENEEILKKALEVKDDN